jgi:hypothetical protein
MHFRSSTGAVLFASMTVALGGCEGSARAGADAPSHTVDAQTDLRLDAGVRLDAPTPDNDAGALSPTCFEPPFGTSRSGLTIDEAAAGGGCSTAIVRPLSEQLIAELECLASGTMADLEGIPGLALSSTALPWLQTPAAAALAEAIADGPGTLTVNSTLRTLPQQFLLYRWYRARLCGITLASAPGTSPHESGLAIDTSAYAVWRSALEAHGWRWHGAGDLVHFDYVSGGVSLPGLSVQAFQRLWNRNHPEDPIAEDGDYGPETESRLRMAPAEGFPIGALCRGAEPGFAVRWELGLEGYTLRAEPPMDAERVAYRIDGREVGEASRAEGFARLVGGCSDGAGHRVDAVAYDAAGTELAARTAYIEASAGDAMYVQPRSGDTFEIGLERPGEAVVAIEVDVDGFALADEVSGATRSARRAVTRTFMTLGVRRVVLRAYGDAAAPLFVREADVALVSTP